MTIQFVTFLHSGHEITTTVVTDKAIFEDAFLSFLGLKYPEIYLHQDSPRQFIAASAYRYASFLSREILEKLHLPGTGGGACKHPLDSIESQTDTGLAPNCTGFGEVVDPITHELSNCEFCYGLGCRHA